MAPAQQQADSYGFTWSTQQASWTPIGFMPSSSSDLMPPLRMPNLTVNASFAPPGCVDLLCNSTIDAAPQYFPCDDASCTNASRNASNASKTPRLRAPSRLWAAAHTLLFPQLDVDDDSDSATLDAQAPDTSKDAQASSSQFHDEPFTLKITGEAAGQIGALYGCCQYDDSSPSLENNIRPTIPIRWHGAPAQTESLLLLVDDMSFKLGNRSWPLVLSIVPDVHHVSDVGEMRPCAARNSRRNSAQFCSRAAHMPPMARPPATRAGTLCRGVSTSPGCGTARASAKAPARAPTLFRSRTTAARRAPASATAPRWSGSRTTRSRRSSSGRS